MPLAYNTKLRSLLWHLIMMLFGAYRVYLRFCRYNHGHAAMPQ